MDIDRGFVAALVEGGRYELMEQRGIRPEMLEGQGRLAFDFVNAYWRRHGRMPSALIVGEQSGVDLGHLPKEPLDFWADEVSKRFLYNGLQQNMAAVLTQMEKLEPQKAAEAWREGFFNLQSLVKETGGVEAIFQDVESIMEEHDRAKLGITGIPSPFPTLNEATQGWQPEELVIIAGRPGLGKSLHPKTKVIKSDGCICEAQEIRVGDKLMGPDGKPRNVLSVHRGREEMFDVIPKRGERWQCNRSHILSLKCSEDVKDNHGYHAIHTAAIDAKFKKGVIYNLTIDQLKALPPYARSKLKLWRTGFELPHRQVSIDPYEMGLWVGGGGYDGDRKIPPDYLFTSRAGRLELLAGLMDGFYGMRESSYRVCGCFSFDTNDSRWCEDLLYLARSLGFAAEAKLDTRKHRWWIYHIKISGDLHLIPNRIIKHTQMKPALASSDNVLETSFMLRRAGVGDYYGFELDGDHLYLLWDTTVTHNTVLLIIMAVHAWLHGNKIIFVSTEMSKAAIKRRFAAFVCKISYGRLRKGKLREAEEDMLRLKLRELSKDKNLLMLGADLNPTIEEVESQCLLHKPTIIFLDGYYLMRSSALANVRNRSERVAEMLDITKAMLKRLKIPALLTTQMNRPPQQKTGGQPTKPDLDRLAFSDNMGMLADYVFFLDRNEQMREQNIMKLMPIKMRESDFIRDLYLNWNFEQHDFTESTRDFDAEQEVEAEKERAAKKLRGVRASFQDPEDLPVDRSGEVGPW